MRFPRLERISQKADVLDAFKGYYHAAATPDGYFYDMENIDGSQYPALAPRAPRRIFRRQTGELYGLHAHDKLYWIAADETGAPALFCEDGRVEAADGLLDAAGGKRQMVSMGGKLLIFPDGVCYNPYADGSDGEPAAYRLDHRLVCKKSDAVFELCEADGTMCSILFSGSAQALESSVDLCPGDGDYWLDTTQADRYVLKQYSSYSGVWLTVADTYLRIRYLSTDGFRAGDGITITGVDGDYVNQEKSFSITGIDGDYVLKSVTQGASQTPCLVIAAPLPTTALAGYMDMYAGHGFHLPDETGEITVERRLPRIDFVAEYENRLWACSGDGHEIYCCKLGDPTNWFCYEGISTDAYAATIGTQGPFTGVAAHLGCVLFFKADCIHKVMGSKPSNFQIVTSLVEGVEPGSEASLAAINEVLFYKARGGVRAYDGSQPADLSAAFGGVPYHDAVADAVNNRYYISMRDEAGARRLFVYDLTRRQWYVQDDPGAAHLTAFGGTLYLDAPRLDGGAILADGGAQGEWEGDVRWFAQTGEIALEAPASQYVVRLLLRLQVPAGGTFAVRVSYDGGPFERLWRAPRAGAARNYSLPFVPRRCGAMRLRFEGTGACRLFSLAKAVEQGSEL